MIGRLYYTLSVDLERLRRSLSSVHGQVVLVAGQVLQDPAFHHLVDTSRAEILQNLDELGFGKLAVAAQVVHDL